MSVLEEIVAKTRLELQIRKAKIPVELFEFEGKTRSLKKALTSAKGNAIITEIKPSSPSQGALRTLDPTLVAKQMEEGGASAISVLTEPFYFNGSLDNLRKAKEATKLPVMRKDFIVDEYQLYEAKHYGADAVLLMVSVLGEETKTFYEKTRELGMEALVEVHGPEEVRIALDSGAEIIGINNRNLKNLKVDLNTTKELSALLKGRVIVSESGINTRADLDFVLKYADAALVGTSLMRADDIKKAVRSLAK